MSRSPVRAGSPRPDAREGARERPETPSHVRLNSAGRLDAHKALESALRAVQLAPSDSTAWDELERRAEASDQPEDVADAYLALLETVPEQHAEALGRRAHLFHEHWFGDDVARMRRVLARVLERCPAAEWAFEAQVTVLTVEGDWQELLDAYDRVLTFPLPAERRRQLLVDVAHVAKDFADQPERAIQAVRELARLAPDELSLGASVARMLGERKQWRALVSLWEAQLEAAPAQGHNGLRLQLAEIHLSELGEPDAALAQAVRVLEQRPGHEEACQMLERVLAAEHASAELRKLALRHLRLHHEAADRPVSVVHALRLALRFAGRDEGLDLRREIARRLTHARDHVAAMSECAELLSLAPHDVDTRLQLRMLADKSGEHERHAAALIAAAQGTTSVALKADLLLTAMREQRDRLGRPDEALELAERVLSLPEADARSIRAAGSAMAELLRGQGREPERIAALERVARAEDDPLERRRLLREVARAWQGLREPARALAAWDERLAHDPQDLEALAEAVELCAELGYHDALAIRLRERAKRVRLPGQRRHDLLRVAQLEASELRAVPRAIETLLLVREEFGEDPELLCELDRLLASTGRYAELASLLSRATARERESSLERLCRLGDLYREQLDDAVSACSSYARALELSPACESARAGLLALSKEKACARAACAALRAAYGSTDDWQLRIELLDAELAAHDQPLAQATAMLEVAELHEQRAGDLARALSLVGKALTRVPERVHVERDLLRLAELTGRKREAAQALHWARAAISGQRERAADLAALEARLLEGLGDSKGARDAYQAVLSVRPTARDALHGLIRSAALAGDFTSASRALLSACVLRNAAELAWLDFVETVARETGACALLCDALDRELGAASELSPELCAVLALRLADLCLTECDDLEGAARAAQRALMHGPLRAQALELLAHVQRRSEAPELVETLLSLDECAPGSLTPLLEAAEAGPLLGASEATMRKVWLRLHERASQLWLRDGKASEAARFIVMASEALVPLELSRGRPEAALTLLESSARLPLREKDRARLRRLSAEILAQRGDLGEALLLGLSMLDEEAADLSFVRFLADLATKLERLPEQLFLRQRELALVTDGKERIALRLEIARLTGALETRDGRLRMMLENLEEQPGHAESLDAACALLTEQRRFRELLAFMAKQAAALVLRGESRRAAMLWRRAALLSEQQLGDPRKAVEFLEQVLVLGDDPRALDEIIRVSELVGDPLHTARWLSQKLAHTDRAERPAVALSLARSYLAGGLRAEAISVLTTSFEESPSHAEVSSLLLSLLREDERRLDLARVLARLAGSCADPDTTVRLAREAARLYHADGSEPGALVEVADLALAHHSDDAELCSMMAEGLSALGRHDEAREVLLHSLQQFGRRRSRERAAVHVQLAGVCRAAGDLESCCAQLELALTMSPGDATIIDELAERAGEAKDLGRRERALRALYLSVKRGPVQLGKDRVVGVSEVLLALSEVAEQRGDLEQAVTMRDSALSALRFDDPECGRIKHALRERGAHDVLEQIVRVELTRPCDDLTKAALLGELAELLERRDATRAQGFQHRLEAVLIDPSDPRLHEAALHSARRCHGLAKFRSSLEKLLERLRRPSDAYARCEVCLRLGGLRAEAGDLAGAEALFADAEATCVREGDVWRAQFELAVTRGDTTAQERLLKKLEHLAPGDPGGTRAEVLYRLAEIRLGNESTLEEGITRMRELVASDLQPQRAARIVLRARSLRKDDVELLGLLGEIARASSELDIVQMAELAAAVGDEAALRALLDLEAGSMRPGLRATLLIELARLLAHRGRDETSVSELLLEALEVRPGDAEAETLLLAHYRRLERGDQAQAFLHARFERALSAQHREDATRYALALHDASEQDDPRAAATLQRAVELAPECAALWEGLLVRLESERERAEVIERALGHASLRDAAGLALEAAHYHRRAGDREAATRVLSLGRKQAPRSVPLLQALIAEVRALDLPETLAELLETAAAEESGPEQRAAQFREAAKLRQKRLGDTAGAVRALSQAVQTRSKDSGLLRELAELLLAEGRVDEGIEQLARAASHARTSTERAALLHARGRALNTQGRLALALPVLEEAFALEPRMVAPDLIAALEQVSKLPAGQAAGLDVRAAVLRLSSIRAARGELALSAEALEGFSQAHPEDDEVLDGLAALYEELGLNEELARVWLRKLGRESGERAEALAQKLGALVPQLSDVEELRRALEQAHAACNKAVAVEEALITTLTFLGDQRAIAQLLSARAMGASDAEQRARCLARAAGHWLRADAVLEAIDALVELRMASPHELGPTLTLLDELIADGRFGEARAMLEAVMLPQLKTPAPLRAQLMVRLARAARGQGDAATALSTMQAARDTDKTNRALLAELAVLAEELAAWDVAEKALTSLILLKDEEVMSRAELLLRRARVARVLNGAKQALLWARKARDEAPDSAEASELVRGLEREA